MRKEIIALACTAADGSPTLTTYKVGVSEEEYDLGYHYDIAIEQALEDGYEAPFVPFDCAEHGELFRGMEELQQQLQKL